MPRRNGGRQINWPDRDLVQPGRVPEWTDQEKNYVFKENPGLTFGKPIGIDEIDLAEQGLYGLWYRFLKINKYEYPPKENINEFDERLRFYKKFGDLGKDFPTWWMERGRELFRERGELPFIRVQGRRSEKSGLIEFLRGALSEHERDFILRTRFNTLEVEIVEQYAEFDYKSEHIVLEIPMKLSRDIIMKQLSYIFRAYHPGDALRRHEFSTAELKIHPRRRYDQHFYEKLLAVWACRRRHPRHLWWQIGMKAQVDPSLDPSKATDQAAAAGDKAELGRLTRALFLQADVMMWHALRGRFPCDSDPDTGEKLFD